MVPSRPLPEAVRGGWYFFPGDGDINKLRKKGDLQVLSFAVDGTYRRYKLKAKSRKLSESGEYTFDGNFLILRGRRTLTFRVRRPTFWRWQLEDKKKSYTLVRALTDDDRRPTLADEQRRDIRLLPLRARIETDHEGEDAIHRIVYEANGGPRQLLATFFVEADEDQHLVGLTPLVEGVEPRTWERIIRESYVDLFLGAPEDLADVTLLVLNGDKPQRLSVG
jgi:hypothetical protein